MTPDGFNVSKAIAACARIYAQRGHASGAVIGEPDALGFAKAQSVLAGLEEEALPFAARVMRAGSSTFRLSISAHFTR